MLQHSILIIIWCDVIRRPVHWPIADTKSLHINHIARVNVIKARLTNICFGFR